MGSRVRQNFCQFSQKIILWLINFNLKDHGHSNNNENVETCTVSYQENLNDMLRCCFEQHLQRLSVGHHFSHGDNPEDYQSGRNP